MSYRYPATKVLQSSQPNNRHFTSTYGRNKIGKQTKLPWTQLDNKKKCPVCLRTESGLQTPSLDPLLALPKVSWKRV